MGTWGAGPFDNDDAGDWAFDFEGADAATGLTMLRDALDLGAPGEAVEAPEGAEAVAAAAVVGWLADPGSIPESGYGEDAAGWVRSAGVSADADLKAAARAALERVRSEDSELAELWDETDDSSWGQSLDEIAARLR